MEKQFYRFVQRVQEENLGVEAVAVADKDRILLEYHFTPDKERNIYSHTKSYMSTAAGIAISEGKLCLEDRLADFFPEKLPKEPQPELFEITLRHLLTMSSGFNHAYLMNADRRNGVGMPDYMSYMLSRKVETKPGREFLYSTADSILAGRMIEKATGKRLSEYLYEKVFEPLDQGYPMWENDAQGHPIGGGGMFMKLADMMKLGQLYLADGKWNGRQLVDREWIREATSKQISTPDEEKSLWSCGYGYQFWLSPYPDSYRADGAFGQITTVLPQKGLAVAVQCPEEGDFEKVKPALHELMSDL